MKDALKAYIDLTRAHFAICWPLLFCASLLLAFERYGGFSWSLLIRAALIGLFGLEAGFVLNDYVDRELDERDVEADKLTRYWRPFRQRPIPAGRVSPRQALGLFVLLVLLAAGLVATLPYPNAAYLFGLLLVSYPLECFYQVKKRHQRFPWAQLVGRIDFALFPAAGYLCYGQPDAHVLTLSLFIYPWTLAHLGVNDLVDVANDRARGLKSVAILYGTRGAVAWIGLFSALHVLVAPLFWGILGAAPRLGFVGGFLLLGLANYKIVRERRPEAGLAALPLFHLAMAVYVTSILLDYAL